MVLAAIIFLKYEKKPMRRPRKLWTNLERILIIFIILYFINLNL